MQLSTIVLGVFALLVTTPTVFSFRSVRNIRYADRLVAVQRGWVESTLGSDDSDKLCDSHPLRLDRLRLLSDRVDTDRSGIPPHPPAIGGS